MTKKIKVLNLYAGIGGNRKLWENVEVTAVENNPEIAKIYQDFFPEDKVIVADAHQFLLEHYKEFDFIWSSPPCQSHSRSRFWGMNRGYTPLFPDLKLYEEILFLKHYFKGFWVIENVIPYYKVLINAKKVGRHLIWSNFFIPDMEFPPLSNIINSLEELEKYHNFSLKNMRYSGDKRVLLRNCIEGEMSLRILNQICCQNCNVPLEEYEDYDNDKWMGCPKCDENSFLKKEVQE